MDAEFADGFRFLQEFVFKNHKEVLDVGARDNGLLEGNIQRHRNSIFHDGFDQDLDPHNVCSEKELEKGMLVYLIRNASVIER